MSKTINISLAFNNAYVPFAYTEMLSICINNYDSEVHFFILQNDLSQESINLLSDLVSIYKNSISFLTVDPNLFTTSLPTPKKWPVEVYFRLLLPSLLPDNIDKIIYLDSDMIVNSSLSKLFSTSLDGFDLAACPDISLIDANLDTFLYYRHPAFADYFNNLSYINSGMLLLNITNIRKNYSLDSYLNAANELDYKIYAPDQDLINYVHKNQILQLDARLYNYPATLAYREVGDNDKLEKEVCILHYTGKKPWSGGDHAHFSTEMLWWKYGFQTPFKEQLSEDFIKKCISDTTVLSSLSGTDEVKLRLLSENARLKREIDATNKSVKKMYDLINSKLS